jgi:SAM-dependent methyltransferase
VATLARGDAEFGHKYTATRGGRVPAGASSGARATNLESSQEPRKSAWPCNPVDSHGTVLALSEQSAQGSEMSQKSQARQLEWHDQWSLFRDDARFLLEEWLAPVTLESLRGLDVLECGCGGGHHTALLSSFAREVTAVDLNTTDIALERNAGASNVRFVEADIASMDLGRHYDCVLCIGVIHHTDDPDQTFASLVRHCRPGGRVAVWAYSAEGNMAMRFVVEPLRRALLSGLPRRYVLWLAYAVTLAIYPFVYSVYLLPGSDRLPYALYFRNWRRLRLARNALNVFDKLNAPQTTFITRDRCSAWFGPDRFEPDSISIRHYCGVSYAMSGVLRRPGERARVP